VGFRPSKSRGQNFLLDGNMARSIARDSGVGAGDFVLEVGPGCGFLSVHLAALGVRLLGIEIDERLLEVARRFLASFEDIELVRADVLAGKHRLAPEVERRLPETDDWHLVSNLPYSVAGPLLVVLSRLAHPPRSMTALVQREVAERITARPAGEGWGVLGAKLAPLYHRTAGRRVPAGLFWPRPRVESAVVRLERRPEDPGPLGAYDALVDGLFQHRRKAVGGTLRGLLGDASRARALLEEAGADPAARPDTLEVATLRALAGSPLWRAKTPPEGR